MVTVRDVYEFIDSVAPFSSQLPFDNSGLLVGDANRVVERVALALDITTETVEEARDLNAELFISHHPVIFKPRKNILSRDPVFRLIESGIAAICAHTSLDCALGGVNDVLAEIFSLTKVEPLSTPSFPDSLLRVGFLKEPMRGIDLAALTAELLNCSVSWADGKKTIETVALCGGSGGDTVNEISELGIDALITGEASYHHFIDAEESGTTLIAAGHFETEFPVIPVLAERIRREFPSLSVSVINQKRTIRHM
ncbi:MAG: Nif3-like dinuclear metal center hexameric protein [Clostridia bacterium]|nr:Nif3-like dinuclear metal center hexameric protein [Clostridia bacterium]